VIDEVLGTSYTATINGVDVELVFPVVDPHSKPDWPLLKSPPVAAHADQDRLAMRLGIDWGNRTNQSWDVAALIASFRISSEGNPPESSEARAIAYDLENWLRLARSWIDAKHSAPSCSRTSSRNTVLHGFHQNQYWGIGGMLTSHVIVGLEGASKAELRGAFKRASQRLALPIQHHLLLDARTHLFTQDYRRAVIDAGTATEVALSALIAKHLNTAMTADATERIITQANGLIGLFNLGTSLGQRFPVSRHRLMNQLAKHRNSAAHGGLVPQQNEAADAVTCARELVYAATPLEFP
jgi:hypothetical protein